MAIIDTIETIEIEERGIRGNGMTTDAVGGVVPGLARFACDLIVSIN
jgi:hypothetical protein